MVLEVKTGVVHRLSETEKAYFVDVESVTFPSFDPRNRPPTKGTKGTLITKQVPHAPYTVAPAPPPAVPANQTIVYEDGNNNNTLHMRVASVVGPAKYNIVVL